MKHFVLCLALCLIGVSANAEDFRLSLEPRKGGVRQGAVPTGSVGVSPSASQMWTGEIKLENVGRQPSGPMRCKYVIYVKRQELGRKMGEEKSEEISGELDVPALKRGAVFSATTSEVTLRQQSLSAGYYVKDGGQGKASDSVSGVWLKLLNGNTEVAEFVNPPTIKTKFTWT